VTENAMLAYLQSVELCWASYRSVQKGWLVRPHAHDYWQFLGVESGSILGEVGEKRIIVTNEKAILAPPDKNHSFKALQNSILLEVKFHVHNNVFNEQLIKVLPLAELLSGPVLSTMKDVIQEGKQMKPYYKDLATIRLYEFIIQLLRHTNGTAHPLESWPEVDDKLLGAGNEMVKSSIDFMKQNLAADLTLEDIASHLGYNANYFCTKFTAVYGMSPMRFLSMLRLKKAAELIAATKLSYSDIAAQVGYGSARTLAKAFYSRYGISPTTYRQHATHFADSIRFRETWSIRQEKYS